MCHASFDYISCFLAGIAICILTTNSSRHSMICISDSFQLVCFRLKPLFRRLLIQSLVQLNKYLLNVLLCVWLWGKYWSTNMRETLFLSSRGSQSSEDKWINRYFLYIAIDSNRGIQNVLTSGVNTGTLFLHLRVCSSIVVLPYPRFCFLQFQ